MFPTQRWAVLRIDKENHVADEALIQSPRTGGRQQTLAWWGPFEVLSTEALRMNSYLSFILTLTLVIL